MHWSLNIKAKGPHYHWVYFLLKSRKSCNSHVQFIQNQPKEDLRWLKLNREPGVWWEAQLQGVSLPLANYKACWGRWLKDAYPDYARSWLIPKEYSLNTCNDHLVGCSSQSLSLRSKCSTMIFTNENARQTYLTFNWIMPIFSTVKAVKWHKS